MSRITFKFLSVEGKGGSSVLFDQVLDGIQCARGVFEIEFDLLKAFVYINSSINFLCTCAKRVLSYRLIQVPWCESKFGPWPTHEVAARFHNETRTIQLHSQTTLTVAYREGRKKDNALPAPLISLDSFLFIRIVRSFL